MSAVSKKKKVIEAPPVAPLLAPLSWATGLLSVPTEMSTLDAMVLDARVRQQLDRVVLEYQQRDVLSVHGLRPARKLLFTGAPGVGKTMAAGALARTVHLSMFRVDLHGVISQFLGETSSKLAKVFDHVRDVPALYLFDEFDALGSDRESVGSESAGAEMRRVVNTLLQLIEDDRSESLIVAATNYGKVLDRAIFRRFDEMISFTPPSKDVLTLLVQRALLDADIGQLDMNAIYSAVANPKLGHADVCAALERVRKDHVLLDTPIDTSAIVDALVVRARPTEVLS